MAEQGEENKDRPIVKKTLAEIIKGNNPPPPPPADNPPPPPPADTPPPPSDAKPLDWFNTKFKTAFEKEEDLETHYTTLAEQVKNLNAQLETATKTATDSVSSFMTDYGITDEQLKFFKAKTMFPDADSSVLNTIITKDLNPVLKEDPIEILVLKERFENPELSDEQATRRIYKKYGIDPENKDDDDNIVIDKDVVVDIRIDAKSAVKSFADAREKIKLPERVDATKKKEEQEQALQQRYDTIKPLLEKEFKGIPDHLDKVEIFKETKGKDGKVEKELVYSFSLGDYGKSAKVKKEIEQAVDYLSRTMPEFNQEFADKAVNQSVEVLKSQRILSMLPDLLLSAKEEWYAQWRKENNIESHNPMRTNPDGKPAPPMTEDEKKQTEQESKFVQKHPKLKPKEVYAR